MRGIIVVIIGIYYRKENVIWKVKCFKIWVVFIYRFIIVLISSEKKNVR